jgi:phosphoglycerate dehydrogenase-like enzyme
MKALFLGNVAADTANGIKERLPPSLRVEILGDPHQLMRAPEAAADADILVTNQWRAEYPSAPRVKLVQSVATGIELIDLAALPPQVTVCNAFGHETAIAEYILMVMLVWSHRFREIEGDFRTRSSWQPSWVQSGAPHGEILGSTVGIVGLGRVGYEVARRAAAFGCRVIAANRSAREPGRGVDQVFPLSELDHMLAECDYVVLCTALGPETEGLIDARRLALMKPSAFLVNIARGAVVDEGAIYAALRDRAIGGAALDVWWRYPDATEPERRPSRYPFHELANVIMTPHCSGWTEGMVVRRWAEVASNINRFVRGEPLQNVVVTT